MTIPAVDADSGDVVLVTELNRLLPNYTNFGHVRRPNHFANHNRYRRDNKHSSEDAQSCESVCAAVKDLGHEYTSTSPLDQHVMYPRIIRQLGRQRGNYRPPVWQSTDASAQPFLSPRMS
jgi:hypothetical protein